MTIQLNRFIFAIFLLLAGCTSNFEEYQTSGRSPVEIASKGPFRINISSMTEVERPLIEAYIRSTFGNDLAFDQEARSSLNFTFISEATTNPYATWRDGTGLVEIRESNGSTIWMAEYNYKGGYEMSGFSVRTNAEAAKLVISRIYKEFSAK